MEVLFEQKYYSTDKLTAHSYIPIYENMFRGRKNEVMNVLDVYIKPRSPQLNGKVERSHRSDQEEFYQLLNYKNDVNLKKKLSEWEQFYNFARPHGAHQGKTPYEFLRDKLV